MCRPLVCLLIVWLSFLFIPSIGHTLDRPLRMGFVPGRSAEPTIKGWAFLIRQLVATTGIPIELVVKDSYRETKEAFERGDLDILEGGAFIQGQLLHDGIAEPLVGETKFDRTTYRSAIVVNASSAIQSLKELQGKSLAFTNELSTSGYILPRLLLKAQGIDDPATYFKTVYFSGEHNQALEMLEHHDVDAIATGDFFLEFMPQEERRQFRIIAVSDPSPLGPITYRRGLDPKIVEDLRKALLEIHERVPFETLRQVQTERFTELSPQDVDFLKNLPNAVRDLQPINASLPLHHARLISSDIYASNYTSLVIVIAISSLIYGMVCFFFSRSRFGVTFPLAFCLVITAIVFLECFFAKNIFETKVAKLSEGLTAFASNVSQLISTGKQPTQIMAQELVHADFGIKAVRAYHNATYVIDSTGLSLEKSIIDNIISNSFSILSKSSAETEREFFFPIWNQQEVWGTAQILFSLSPFQNLKYRLMFMHFCLLFLLTVFCLFGYHVFIRSSEKISKNLKRVERDLSEKQSLLELKNQEITFQSTTHSEHLPTDLIIKIKNLLSELGEKHTNFQQLRATELLGESNAFVRMLMDAIIRSKDIEPSVIVGETGSGKTGVAKAIHLLSLRSEQPWGEYNCAEFASADPLVVLGKLFGYGKNSGIQGIPKEGQKGLLESFDGGTLFLDEVENLPLQAQQLLLLPLEGRPFNVAAGTSTPRKIDVRFIFASNVPLEKAVESGLLRQDLYRRMAARGEIHVPPLRERHADIPLLAKHFLAAWNASAKSQLAFGDDAWELITAKLYDKFNVSELKSLIAVAADRAHFLGETIITAAHLQLSSSTSALLPEPATFFDAEEQRELAVLRQYGFNISLAEEKLGFSKGAKTLSNRFRGMCYKAIHHGLSQGKAPQLLSEHAALLLVGDTDKSDLVLKIVRKVERFYDRLKNSSREDVQLVLNNLPKKYHDIASLLRRQ